MTYKEYIDKLNKLYVIRHQYLLNLVETEKIGTFPFIQSEFEDEKDINIAEEVEQVDKKIYALVSAASKEPWYRKHCNRFDQFAEILF